MMSSLGGGLGHPKEEMSILISCPSVFMCEVSKSVVILQTSYMLHASLRVPRQKKAPTDADRAGAVGAVAGPDKCTSAFPFLPLSSATHFFRLFMTGGLSPR